MQWTQSVLKKINIHSLYLDLICSLLFKTLKLLLEYLVWMSGGHHSPGTGGTLYSIPIFHSHSQSHPHPHRQSQSSPSRLTKRIKYITLLHRHMYRRIQQEDIEAAKHFGRLQIMLRHQESVFIIHEQYLLGSSLVLVLFESGFMKNPPSCWTGSWWPPRASHLRPLFSRGARTHPQVTYPISPDKKYLGTLPCCCPGVLGRCHHP